MPSDRRLAAALALLSAIGLATAARAEEPARLYAQQTAQPTPGTCVMLPVNLEESPGFSVESADQGLELRYRMNFNNITEGWNWHPEADPAAEDYYHYKYLPLQSVPEERPAYTGEDMIGEPQTVHVTWRYDYFLAFTNLYDFYARSDSDDAGFVARIAAQPELKPGMRAKACLEEPVTSESTTFLKATHHTPNDFTLKKRYLVGHLEAVEFFDQASGQVLATLSNRPERP